MSYHLPVLLEETLRVLGLGPGAKLIDGTVGDGGHSEAILERLRSRVEILGIDLDRAALETAKARLGKWGDKVRLLPGNFRDIEKIALRNRFQSVAGVLLDLGVRSAEIEESGLGFSFRRDEPLIMRFDGQSAPPNAATIVNSASREELIRIFREYGEEPFAERIAEAIVRFRRRRRILRTTELVRIIVEALPRGARHGKTHCATRVFQALRIATNDELRALREAIAAAFRILAPGGVLAIISFHSLEDRIVKTAMRQMVKESNAVPVTKKPIIPAIEEIRKNPRSRSAKLRAVKKM
jgi:16S rRNA (cytosine1402-N4)-methyltransferase